MIILLFLKMVRINHKKKILNKATFDRIKKVKKEKNLCVIPAADQQD